MRLIAPFLRSRSSADLNSSENLRRLSLSYFFCFGLLGVIVPYTSVFLDGRGLSSYEIGSLLGIVTLTRVLGPNLWANLADRTGKTVEIVRFGCLMATSCFISVFWLDGFWPLTFAFSSMMLFWTAVLPQLEVICVQASQHSKGGYGAIRLWGSVGFIVFTVAMGLSLDLFGSEAVLVSILLCLICLYISTLYVTQAPIKANEQGPKASLNEWSRVFKAPFLVFLLAASLLQVSFASYYNFFALYAQSLGFSGATTGLLLAVAVTAEIIIFLFAKPMIKRLGVKALLVASFFITAVRWLILAYFAQIFWLVLLSQLLHAFSFGVSHAAAVYFIHQYFSDGFLSRAQALYSSIAFGLGGAFGSYIVGITWQQGEGAVTSFVFSAACVGVAGVLMLMCPNYEPSEKQK